jgi:hypothetical protein
LEYAARIIEARERGDDADAQAYTKAAVVAFAKATLTLNRYSQIMFRWHMDRFHVLHKINQLTTGASDVEG